MRAEVSSNCHKIIEDKERLTVLPSVITHWFQRCCLGSQPLIKGIPRLSSHIPFAPRGHWTSWSCILCEGSSSNQLWAEDLNMTGSQPQGATRAVSPPVPLVTWEWATGVFSDPHFILQRSGRELRHPGQRESRSSFPLDPDELQIGWVEGSRLGRIKKQLNLMLKYF